LAAEPDTVIDVFRRDVEPVLTIEPGDTVIVRTLDAMGHLESQRRPGEERPLMLPARRGHCLTGPIAVRGARPGQLLSVRLESLQPDNWGHTGGGGRDNLVNRALRTASEETAHLLWALDPDGGVGVDQHGHRVPLSPFLGVVGTAPDEDGPHSTIPPRPRSGGNIDCRELVAGSVLYLPVNVPLGYLFVGDGHAAQGDGEVGGTAIECAMTTELTVDVVRPVDVDGVHAETPAGRITFGFSADLNQATLDALTTMVTWMQSLLGLDRAAALALASVVVDLRVTQIANETWGAHAVLPHDRLKPTPHHDA
jgi:acetamidase/formamidase